MKASGETKLLIVLGAVVLLGALALFALDKAVTPKASEFTPPPQLKMANEVYEGIIKDARYSKEAPGAQVTIIEFADFECSSCRRAYQGELGKLLKDPKRPVRLVYRHFPLDNHKFAVRAATAAEAAGKQGKFWEMYAALFDRQEGEMIDEAFIQASAVKVGLDMAKYQKDIDDPALLALVEKDKQAAIANQIIYTPTFLIRDQNGEITSAVGGDDLKIAMDKIFGGGSDTAAPANPSVGPAPAPKGQTTP